MTPAEAAALLTIAAAYDNRKPDEDQARAWAMILADLRFEDCRDAVLRHYRKSREWLMPAEVIEGVREIRSERWEKFIKDHTPGYLPIPRRFDGDPAAEQAWWAEVAPKIRNGEITTAAELDADADEYEPIPRDVESLGLVGRPVPPAASRAAHPTHTDTESE
jgi:hypothetical protein